MKTRANTITGLRIARRALYGVAAASFLLILLGTPEGINESEASSEKSPQRVQSLAYLLPNKEVKIYKASIKK